MTLKLKRGQGVGDEEWDFRRSVGKTLLSFSFFPGQSNRTLTQQCGYLVWLTQGMGQGNREDLPEKVKSVRPCRGALNPKEGLGTVCTGSLCEV